MNSQALKTKCNEENSELDTNKFSIKNITHPPINFNTDGNPFELSVQNTHLNYNAGMSYNKYGKAPSDVKRVDKKYELMQKTDKETSPVTDINKKIPKNLRISRNEHMGHARAQGKFLSDSKQMPLRMGEHSAARSSEQNMMAGKFARYSHPRENNNRDLRTRWNTYPENNMMAQIEMNIKRKLSLEHFTYNDYERRNRLPRMERQFMVPDRNTSGLSQSDNVLDILKDCCVIPQVYSMKFQLDIVNTNPLELIENIEFHIGKDKIINIQAYIPDTFCCSTLCKNACEKLCKEGFAFKGNQIKVHPVKSNVLGLSIAGPLSISEDVIKRKLNKKVGRVIAMKGQQVIKGQIDWILIVVTTKPIPKEMSFSNMLLPITVESPTL